MTADVTISCPHCRRQYTMKIDPERLQRLKTRATCGRCGKTFDVASRITPAGAEPATEPKLPRIDVVPPRVSELQPTPKPPASVTTATPDLRDEMEELAREFAEAAARFTPVGIKRSSVGGGTLSSEAPPAKPAAVEEPTNPGVRHASLATEATPATATAATARDTHPTIPAVDEAAVAESYAAISATVEPAPAEEALSLEAEPATEEEFAAAVPTLSRITAPRSWLELADPGLAALQSPPSPGAAALEALLNDPETIALPPPPAAS